MGKQKVIQLTLQLPALDSDKTRDRLEEGMETIRVFRQVGIVRKENKMTTSYSPRYGGGTGAVGKPTEEIAIWNVDKEAELQKLSEQLDRALNRLGKLERTILERRYLEEDMQDCILCGELSMSDRQYRRVKARAIYKLAFAMHWDVLADEK